MAIDANETTRIAGKNNHQRLKPPRRARFGVRGGLASPRSSALIDGNSNPFLTTKPVPSSPCSRTKSWRPTRKNSSRSPGGPSRTGRVCHVQAAVERCRPRCQRLHQSRADWQRSGIYIAELFGFLAIRHARSDSRSNRTSISVFSCAFTNAFACPLHLIVTAHNPRTPRQRNGSALSLCSANPGRSTGPQATGALPVLLAGRIEPRARRVSPIQACSPVPA